MAGATRFARRIRNVRRLAEIARVLVRHGFGEVVTRLRLPDALPARLMAGLALSGAPRRPTASRGERLRAMLVELGPTYVKLGQVLSTRPDLIPPDICADLEALQDHVPPISGAEAAQVIEAELGHAPADLFASFDETPAASASVSQVHRAQLKDGTAVAVKVQRPGVAAVIHSDVELLESLAAWIVGHGIRTPGFDPVGTVSEFARSVRRELDFTQEARTVERFAREFRGSDIVHCPAVHAGLCTPRVLTMEWVAGTSLRDLDRLTREGHDLRRVAHNGVEVVLRQIFEHGLFHGDPHPGNIFVLPGDVICLLDYGMVGQLTPEDTERFADLLWAVFHKDATQATAVVLEVTQQAGEIDRRALERDLQEFIEFDAERIMEGRAFGEALNCVVTILRNHRLVMPARYTLLIKALVTVERVGRDLDPSLDLAAQMRPYVERLLKQRYSARRVVSELSRAVRAIFALGRALPADLRELVWSFKREGLRVALRPEDVQRVALARERAARWLSLGMIIGALLVGSALLMHLSGGPKLLGLPVPGLLGYLIAAILGLNLAFSMRRARRP